MVFYVRRFVTLSVHARTYAPLYTEQGTPPPQSPPWL